MGLSCGQILCKLPQTALSMCLTSPALTPTFAKLTTIMSFDGYLKKCLNSGLSLVTEHLF